MCAMTTETQSQAATEEAHEKVAAWAEQLAHRLQQAHDAPAEVETPAEAVIPSAIAALWALVDEAVTQATTALVQAGLSERIQTFRTDQEFQLGMEGPEGDARYIRLFVGLRSVHGHLSGGAQITTSATRATIYLLPSAAGERVRWRVAGTRAEFTARVVDDLLLSVFANDPAATRRLGPSFSIDENT